MTACGVSVAWTRCQRSTDLVNVTEGDSLDALVLEHLSDDTSVSTANNKHILRVRVRGHRQVRDHLLVRELVSLSALDDIVEDKDVSVRLGLEHEDVLG
jgi:hypothetical protein